MTSEAKQVRMMKTLKIAIANQHKLSNAMSDYDNGIEAESTDRRGLYEKLDDSNYTNQDFHKKVYNLFNNDEKASETFMDNFNDDIGDFNIVYPQLLTLFKGKHIPPLLVVNTAQQLIDNFNESGVVNGSKNSSGKLDGVIAFLQQQHNEGNVKKAAGDDMIDKLNALNVLLYSGDDMMDDFNTLRNDKSKYSSVKGKIRLKIDDLLRIITTKSGDDKLEDITKVLTSIKQDVFYTLNEPSKIEQEESKLNIALQQQAEQDKLNETKALTKATKEATKVAKKTKK